MDIYLDKYIDDYNNSTRGINEAIKYLNKNGGGRLIFSANKTYRSGMIILLSNVELYFEKNSILKGSDNILDYNYLDNDMPKALDIPTYKDCSYNGHPTKFFIYAFNENNIKISGDGIIDGNEEIFYGKQNDHHIDGSFYPRVPLIYFEGCNNFEIKNINIRKSGFWTIHLIGCNGGIIDSININNNRKFACTDGIDPDHSKNIIIRNSYIESADDCVVFKSTEDNMKYGDTENISVENCVFKSTSAAIKFGSESCGNIHNINVKNIKVLDTNRGISFQLRDTGNIYDINISNINIVSENGIFIYGENNISNINLSNINLELKRFTDFITGNHDLRPYYKDEYLINRKTEGIYLNGASNVHLNNVKIKVNDNFKDLFSNMIYIENINDLSIE